MKKYIAVGIVIGLVVALGIGWGATTILAQGPTPTTPTVDRMKTWHEAMHGAGTWAAMAQQMEQVFGKDWFNQMHSANGIMNNGGLMRNGNVGNMMGGMNGQNHMGSGGMMGSGTNPPAQK